MTEVGGPAQDSRTGLDAPQEYDRVLSSMCTTPHPAAREAATAFLETNPGDPATFPTVSEMETEAVAQLASIAELETPHGYIATGGTEANLQAVRAARNLSGTSTPNVVVPENAHFSFQKAADVLGVELRVAAIDANYRGDPASVAGLIDDDTILVVAVAGSTEYGRVDPIPEIARLATDAGARVHVDAAWGGFILPFTDHDWSFADAQIDSMTIDPHKMGQAAIPAGGLLVRDRALLDALAVDTPYLETKTQATLTGTRSGAGVASAVAAMDALWPDGYRAVVERAQENATWLADAFERRGFDSLEPELPLVTVEMNPSLFDALQDEGWRIARTGAGELRIVCNPHVTRERLTAFLSDLDAI